MKSPTSQVETRAPLHIPPPDGTHAKPFRVTNSPLLPLPPLLSLHPIHRCPSILCLLASIQVPRVVTNLLSRKLTLPSSPLLCSQSPSDQQSSRQGVLKTALYYEKSAFVCPAAAFTFDSEEFRKDSRPHRLGYADVGRNTGLLSFFDLSPPLGGKWRRVRFSVDIYPCAVSAGLPQTIYIPQRQRHSWSHPGGTFISPRNSTDRSTFSLRRAVSTFP